MNRFKLNISCLGIYEIPEKGDIEMQAMACTEISCDSEFAEDLAGLFPKMTGYYSRGDRLCFQGDGKIVLQPR